MNLTSTKTFRLYDVSTKLDEHGYYGLEAFTNNAFNEVIGEEELNETLGDLAGDLFGQSSRWHEITDNVMTGKNGKLCIDLDNNDWLEVRDIVAQIDADQEDCRFYVLVNASRMEYGWVVAVPEGTVYSD